MSDFKYMLDTSTCIELLHGNEKVRQRCINENQYCCISVITAIELLYGAYGAPKKYYEQELSKARMLIDYYSVIEIGDATETFCKEKIRLEKAGTPIEDFDLLIGASAKEYNLTVVTHNIKHFNRVEGLDVDDWTK